ncbi:MAG: hypothetical protein PHS88_05815, partial [Candidatus Omnitrophica bacterium]|nr:hypothetical protein [Candidatus Omnitrophota bacterium]
TLHKFLQNAGYRTYNLLLDQNTWVLEHASDIRQLSHRAGWNGTRSAWIDLANTPLGTLRERSHILTDIYDSFHGAYVFEDRRFGLLQDVFDGCAVIATIPHLEWAWMQRPANGAEAELDPDGFLPFSFRLQANMINFAQGRMSRDDFDRLLGLTGSVRYSLDGGQSWSVRTTDLPVYPDSFRVENITEINDGRVLLDISAKFRPPEAAVNGRILFNIMIQNQAAENIWFTNHPEQNWSLAIKPAARSETRSKIAEWAEKYARRHQDTLSAVPEFEDPPAFLGWFQEHRHLFPSDNHPGKFHGPVYAAQVLSFAGKIPPEKLHNIQRNAAAFQRARKDRKAISGEIRRIWSKPAARWYRTPLARLHYQFDARKLPHRGRQSQTEPVSPSYRHLILTFACGLYGYELIRQIVRKRLRAISPRDYDSFAAWLRATGIGAPEANLESAADWAIEEWFRDRSVPTIPEIESFAAAFGADAAELIRLVFREEKYQAAATANVLTQTFTDSNVEVPPNIRVAVSEALAIFEGSLKKQTRSRKQLESLKIRTKRKEIRALGREVRIPLPELFRDNVAAVSPEGDRLWRRQPFDMMAFVNCENPADYVIAVFIADRTDAANDQVVFLGAGRAVSTIRVPQKRGISQDLIETQAGFLTDLAWRARDEHYRDPENRDAFVIEQFEQGDLFHAIAMPARDRNLGFPDLRRVPMWSPLKGHLWYVGRRGHPLKDAPRALVHVVKTRRGKIRPFRLPDGRLDYLFLLPDRDRIQFYDSLQVNPQSENPDANAQVPLLSIPAQGENFSLSDSPECLTFYLRILARYGNWNVRPVLARQHVVKRKGKRTRKVTKQTKPRVEFTLGKTPGKPGMTFYLDSEYRGILAFLLSRGTAVSNGGIPTWRLYRVGPGQMDDEGHLIDRQGKAVSLEDVQLTPDGKWLDQHQTELDMEAPQLVTEIAPVQGAFHLSMMAQRPSQSVPLYQGTGFSLARVLSGYPLRATSSTVVGVSFRYADQVWERREFQIIELLKSQKSGDSFHVAEGVPSVLHGNGWADKVRGLHYLLTQALSSPEIKAMGFVFTELARISSVIFRSTAIPGTDDLFRRLGSDLKEITVKIPRGRNRTLVTFVASFLANPTQVPVKLTDDVLRILVETGDESTRSEMRRDSVLNSESGIRNQRSFRNPQSAFSISKNRSETRAGDTEIKTYHLMDTQEPDRWLGKLALMRDLRTGVIQEAYFYFEVQDITVPHQGGVAPADLTRWISVDLNQRSVNHYRRVQLEDGTIVENRSFHHQNLEADYFREVERVVSSLARLIRDRGGEEDEVYLDALRAIQNLIGNAQRAIPSADRVTVGNIQLRITVHEIERVMRIGFPYEEDPDLRDPHQFILTIAPDEAEPVRVNMFVSRYENGALVERDEVYPGEGERVHPDTGFSFEDDETGETYELTMDNIRWALHEWMDAIPAEERSDEERMSVIQESIRALDDLFDAVEQRPQSMLRSLPARLQRYTMVLALLQNDERKAELIQQLYQFGKRLNILSRRSGNTDIEDLGMIAGIMSDRIENGEINFRSRHPEMQMEAVDFLEQFESIFCPVLEDPALMSMISRHHQEEFPFLYELAAALQASRSETRRDVTTERPSGTPSGRAETRQEIIFESHPTIFGKSFVDAIQDETWEPVSRMNYYGGPFKNFQTLFEANMDGLQAVAGYFPSFRDVVFELASNAHLRGNMPRIEIKFSRCEPEKPGYRGALVYRVTIDQTAAPEQSWRRLVLNKLGFDGQLDPSFAGWHYLKNLLRRQADQASEGEAHGLAWIGRLMTEGGVVLRYLRDDAEPHAMTTELYLILSFPQRTPARSEVRSDKKGDPDLARRLGEILNKRDFGPKPDDSKLQSLLSLEPDFQHYPSPLLAEDTGLAASVAALESLRDELKRHLEFIEGVPGGIQSQRISGIAGTPTNIREDLFADPVRRLIDAAYQRVSSNALEADFDRMISLIRRMKIVEQNGTSFVGRVSGLPITKIIFVEDAGTAPGQFYSIHEFNYEADFTELLSQGVSPEMQAREGYRLFVPMTIAQIGRLQEALYRSESREDKKVHYERATGEILRARNVESLSSQALFRVRYPLRGKINARAEVRILNFELRQRAEDLGKELATGIDPAAYRDHVQKILQLPSNQVYQALLEIDRSGGLAKALPFIDRMKAKPRYGEGISVFGHSFEILRRAHELTSGDMAGFMTDYVGWKFDPETAHAYAGVLATATSRDRELLNLIILLHDLGVLVQGAQHAAVGSEMIPAILEKLGLDRDEAKLVTWVVNHHIDLSTLQSGERRIFYHALEELPPVLRDRATRFLALLSIAESRAVYQPERDQGKFIEKMNAVFYLDAMNPEKLEGLREHFGEYRLERFSALGGDAGPVDEEKHRKVLDIIERDLPRTERPQFDLAMQEIIEVFDYANFFLQSLDAGAMVKILYLFSQIEKKYENRFSEIIFNAPTAEAHRAAQNVQPVLHGYDFAALTLGSKEFDRILELLAITVDTENGQINVNNHQFVEASAVPSLPRSEIRLPPPAGEAGDGQKREGAETDATRTSEVSPQEQSAAKETRYRQAMATLLQKWGAESLDSEMLSDLTSEEIASLGLDDEIFFESVTSFSEADQRTIRNDIIRQALFRAGKDQCDYQKVHRLVRDAVIYDADPGNRYLLRKMMTHTVLFIALSSLGVFATLWFMPVSWHSIWLNLLALPVVVMVLHLTHVLLNDDASKENETDLGRIAAFNIAAVIILLSISRGVLLGILNSLVAAVNFYLVRNYVLRISEEDMPFSRPPFFLMSSSYVIAKKSLLRSDVYRHAVPLGIYLSKNVPAGLGAEFDEVFRLANAYFETGSKRALEAQLIYYKLRRWFWGSYSDEAAMAAIVAAVDGKMGRESADEMMHAMLGGGWRKVLERLAQTAMREEAGSGEGKTSRTSARGDSVPVQEETRAVGQAVSQRNGEVVRDIEILRREFEPSYPWSFVYQELAELLNAVPRNTQAIAHLLRDINWLLDFLRANFASEEMRSPYAHRALVNQISHRLFDGTANPQNVYVDNRAIRMAALIGLSSSGQYKAGMNSVYVTDLSARDRAYRAISDYIMSETESTERSESRLAKRQTQDTSPKTPDRIARDKGDVSSFENSKLETLNPELNQVRSETRTPDSQDAQTDGGFYGVFYRDEATDGPETKLVPVTEGMRKDILHLIRPDVLWTPDTAQGEPFTVTHKKRHGHPRGAAYLDRNQSAIVKSIERLQTALGRPVKLALYEYSFHTAQPVPRHLMMRRDDYDVFGLAGFARAPGDLVSFRDAEGTVHMPIDYFVPGLDPDMQHELAVEAVMAALATDQESLLRDLREHSRRVLFHSDRFALPLSDQLERQMPPEKTIPLLAAVMRFEILWNEVLWQLPPAETDLTPHEKTIKLLTLQTIGMGFTHARQIGAEVLGGFLEKWFTPKMAKAICDYVRNSSVNEGIALGMEDFRLAMRHDAVMGFFHATETLRSLAEQAPVEESPTAMTKTEWDLLGKLEEMWHEQRAMPPDEMLDAILQKHDVLLVQAQPEHVADFMPLLQRSGNLPAKSLVAFPLIPRSREDSLVEKLWARRVFFGEATWKDIARAVNAYLIDGNPEPLRHLTTQRDEKRFDQVIAHFRSFRRLNQRGAGIRYFPSFELHDLDSTVTTSAELEARMRVYLTDLTEYRAETGSEKMVLLQELPVTLHVGPQILHLQKQGPNDEDLLQKLAKSKDFFGAEDVAAATAVHVTYDLAKVDPRASLPKVFSQWNRGSFGSEVDDSFGLMCVAPNELPGYPYIFYNFQYVLIFALIKKPGGGEAHAGSPAPDPSLAVYPPGHDLEDTVVSGSRQRSESRETVGSRQQNVQRKTYSGEHPSVVRSRSYVTDQRSELRAKDKVPVMPKRRGRGLALWQKINRKFPNGGFTIDQLQAMRGMGRIGNRETLLSLIKLFEDLELVTRQREEVTPKSKGRPYVIRISDRVRKLKPQNIEELEFVLSGCTTRRADFAYVQPQVRRILGGERLFRLRKTQTGLFFDYHQKEKALKKKDPRITHPYLYITFCQLRKLFGQEWVNIGAFRERVKGIDRDTLALHINQFDDWGLVERGRVDKSGQGEWVRLACDPTRLDRVEAALLAGSMKGEEYRTGYTVRQILNGKQTLADKLQPPVTADPFGVVYSVTQPRIKVTLPAVGRAIRNVEATNPPVKLQKIQRQIGVSTNTLKQFDNKRPGILRRLGIPALDLRIRSQADAEKFEALIDA